MQNENHCFKALFKNMFDSKVGTGKSRKYFGTNRYRQGLSQWNPATQQLRDSIDKWDFIELKSFC
jgi:hypothetical protein